MSRKRNPETDVLDVIRMGGWLVNGHEPAKKGDVTVIALAELLRRDAESNAVDGYPATSMGGSGNHGGDVARPTEAAAQRIVDDEHVDTDVVHNAVHGIEEHLARAADHLRQAVSLSYLVWRKQQTTRTVNEPKPCQACGKLVSCTTADPIRSGWCQACAVAYRRWSNEERVAGREPDRATFERTRQENAA